MLIAFWIFFGLLVYSYIVYPLLLAMGSMVLRKKHTSDDQFAPSVTLIIPAYNEDEVIRKKIENSLSVDYPRDKLQVVVASDASTDKTVEVAKYFLEDGVKIEDYTERKGKMAVVNATVLKTECEILVLTDANAMFERSAVRKLVRHFADPQIGCVCGAKRIVSGEFDIGSSESLYWKYENLLKKMESTVGSCPWADGSIYALRRELYPFPREDRMIMDDLAVSLKVIEKGYRVIFDEDAKAYESTSVRILDEFRRKARILSGALAAVASSRRLLVPLLSPIWIQLYSHKIVRWSGGVLMLGALLTNLFLIGYLYRTILVLQLIFYAMALVGLILQASGRRGGKLSMPFYFVLTNAAQLLGFWRFLVGREKPAWERLERETG